LIGQEVASYNREAFFNDIIDFDNQSVGYNDISIGQVFKGYGSERVFLIECHSFLVLIIP